MEQVNTATDTLVFSNISRYFWFWHWKNQVKCRFLTFYTEDQVISHSFKKINKTNKPKRLSMEKQPGVGEG